MSDEWIMVAVMLGSMLAATLSVEWARRENQRRNKIVSELLQSAEKRERELWALWRDLSRAEKEASATTLEKVMRMQREGFIAMPEAEPAVVHEGEEQEGEWYAPEPINWRTPPPDSA